jgi:hypothetical protein
MFKENGYGIYDFETKNFIIRYQATEEEMSYEFFHDMEDNDNFGIIKDIESGDLIYFIAEVSVIFKESNEVLAIKSLGGNIYKDYTSFMDHFGLGYTSLINKLKKEKDQNQINIYKKFIKQFEDTNSSPWGSYFRDLVKETISEAKENETLKTFFALNKIKKNISRF